MIKNITFPETGTGYIYKKLDKPIEPTRNRFHGRMNYTRDNYNEDYENALKQYKEELVYYNEHKDEYKLECAKFLIGRTINFEANKINIIFGSNGSGKTTILKALAGNALIPTDGLTKIVDPMEISYDIFGELTFNDILNTVDRYKQNTSIINWDGAPIYFDNFQKTKEQAKYFGDLSGSTLKNTGDEVQYLWIKDKISQGQNTIFIFSKILSIIENKLSLKDIIKPWEDRIKSKCLNDVWTTCYKYQIDYLKQFKNFDKPCPITVLFDEVDKSLDILNVWHLYSNILPTFVKKTNTQVILITHNPLILTESIRNNDIYNIISIDEEYTNNILKTLNSQKF